jgi:predicted cupin superfamily sugar epimerase
VPLDAETVVARLGLEPLPGEGGFYRESYRSEEQLPADALPERYGAAHPMGTAIYFLLTDAPEGFSAWHRLPTDEVYHFYLGDPVVLYQLLPGGRGERTVLGQDIAAGQQVQVVARCRCWQASRLLPGGRWALLGTTMAPGFEWADFELGSAEELLAGWPAQEQWIRELVR